MKKKLNASDIGSVSGGVIMKFTPQKDRVQLTNLSTTELEKMKSYCSAHKNEVVNPNGVVAVGSNGGVATYGDKLTQFEKGATSIMIPVEVAKEIFPDYFK